MDNITMTSAELATLHQELRRLEMDGRREIAARIKTAREWGDLKENSEYHAAKEDQAHLETRILKLRDQVRRASVVEVTAAAEIVGHGSTVSYTDRVSGRTQTFKIVSPQNANPAEGSLSVASPIAQALIGARVGDIVEAHTPTGARALEVHSIS
jgi:transcription elongation factor GreA